MKRYFGILFCFFVAITAHFSCTSPNVAGGSTSTDNGRIVGKIYQENGLSAPNTQVTLRPVDFDPYQNAYTLQIDTTDQAGNYTFTKVAHGTYTLEAVDLNTQSRALVNSVIVDSISTYPPVAILAKPGIIKVQLNDSAVAESYLYIPGTSISSMIHTMTVVIDSVPAGTIPSLCFKTKKNSTPRILRYDITVQSGQTETVLNPDWSHAKRICFNTTPSGADITGSVTDFPVLIRLTSANFDFTQAKSNGDDIRFAKSDTTFLPYEIERWDPVTQVAEVWVKTDTIYGNDSMQVITMYWGNKNAVNTSSSAAVFDTSSGFEGVWHLGETDTLAADATGNHYNGTGYFTTPVAGMIGKAQHFNGVSSYIQMKGTAPQSRLNFPMNGHYTISVWFFHDTLADSVTYLIAGKGEYQYFMKNFDLSLSTQKHERQWEFTEYHGSNTWQAATYTPATEKEWINLVGIRDGSNQYLYVNGALAMEGYQVIGTGQDTISRDTTEDFTLGAFLNPVPDWNQGYAYFSGAIDEVDVSSLPRSADWIKLSYMNQRADDKLIIIDK